MSGDYIWQGDVEDGCGKGRGCSWDAKESNVIGRVRVCYGMQVIQHSRGCRLIISDVQVLHLFSI